MFCLISLLFQLLLYLWWDSRGNCFEKHWHRENCFVSETKTKRACLLVRVWTSAALPVSMFCSCSMFVKLQSNGYIIAIINSPCSIMPLNGIEPQKRPQMLDYLFKEFDTLRLDLLFLSIQQGHPRSIWHNIIERCTNQTTLCIFTNDLFTLHGYPGLLCMDFT